MSGIILLILAVIFYIMAYFIYGRYLGHKFSIRNITATPAHIYNDGFDYIPTSSFVVFGHHFSSIAGVGPIIGPIIALGFGWLPVYIWVLLGAVFIGGVHDISALMMSIRSSGQSIAQILEKQLGLPLKKVFLILSWITIVLVIAVFINVISQTFIQEPVSMSSSCFIMTMALGFGVLNKYCRIPLLLNILVAVLCIIGSIYLGYLFPFTLGINHIKVLLLLYIWLAACLPIWVLLQPRDYLNSFLLYFMMIGGVLGICFSGGFTLNITSFTGFQIEKLGFFFPALFITVACGAISGFHSWVASGTTSKQLNRESDAKIISYGGMLLEGFLAIMVVIAVGSLDFDRFSSLYSSNSFVSAFSEGLGGLIANIPFCASHTAAIISLISLTVSAFALTTLDTSARLGRLALEEICEGKKNKFINKYTLTSITVISAGFLCFSGSSTTIWPVFGTANQLMACITLLVAAVWLSSNHKNVLFLQIPAIFMLCVTLTSLAFLIWYKYEQQNYLLVSISGFLLMVLLYFSWTALSKLFIKKKLP